MSYKLVRPLLFRLDPERAHRLALKTLSWLGRQPVLLDLIERCFCYEDPRLEREVLGLKFRNPLGLAAGFDKDAEAVPALAALGFGFLEVGSVSARPSPGNPRPRIFRLPRDRAIINRMGIPSAGADRVAARLAALRAENRIKIPLGINLSLTTGPHAPKSRQDAVADYRYSLSKLYYYADYLAINISCPNLPELRFDPQEPADLHLLLAALQAERERLSAATGIEKPLLLKLSPDLSAEQLKNITEIALQHEIDGFIAVNTTTARDGLKTRDKRLVDQQGGLSGAPLRLRAREVVAQIQRLTKGRTPIIGVGGVFTAQDAWEMFRAGTDLVQIYTGLIYEGPGIVRRINRGLIHLLEKHDCPSLDAIRD